MDVDVLVIGMGAAGVAAARAAHEHGARVAVVSAGHGATALTSGLVWGHARDPLSHWGPPALRVGGRYATVSGWITADARGALASLLDLSALAPGMLAVIDLPTHPSWSARSIAQTLGARVVTARFDSEETFLATAARLDTEGIAEGLAVALRADCAGCVGVLFPPVLGLRRDDVAQRFAHILGVPVGETAGGVGDPPGVRLERAIRRWLPEEVLVRRAHATVKLGARPSVALSDGVSVRTRTVVLATGGLSGGGLVFDATLREATAGAPVWTRTHVPIPKATGAARGADPVRWFGDGGDRAEAAGVRVGDRCLVLDGDGESPLAPWLFAAGDVTVNREGDGLADALAAGCRAGMEAARYATKG
jgi:glycine/D-amino acid oxidase-like deaminating enzyme